MISPEKSLITMVKGEILDIRDLFDDLNPEKYRDIEINL